MPTSSLAGKVQDAMLSANREQMEEQINTVFNGLVTEVERSVLPEKIFKEEFLPYFTGEKPITADNPRLAMWVSIAGTATSEVDIINDAKEVLFTVPPLLDTAVINTAAHERGTGFRDIFLNSKAHGASLPVLGERYLAEALGAKLSSIISPSDSTSINAKKWEAIYARYGVKSATTAETVPDGADDDLEY